jgi:hypothetical protein
MKTIEAWEKEPQQEYFLSFRDSKGEAYLYESEKYRFEEQEILNLIRICIKEMRNMKTGTKILSIYKDSTKHREEITKERLEKNGIIEDEQPEPTKERKPISK